MMPFNPPFLYKCNSCSKIFSSRKRPLISMLVFKPKCPKCGSKDTESMEHIIKK